MEKYLNRFRLITSLYVFFTSLIVIKPALDDYTISSCPHGYYGSYRSECGGGEGPAEKQSDGTYVSTDNICGAAQTLDIELHDIDCADERSGATVAGGLVLAPTGVSPYFKRGGVSCRTMNPDGSIDKSKGNYTYKDIFVSDGNGENTKSSLDEGYLPVAVLLKLHPVVGGEIDPYCTHGVPYFVSAVSLVGLKAEQIIEGKSYDWIDKEIGSSGNYSPDRDQMRIDGAKISKWAGYDGDTQQAILQCGPGDVIDTVEFQHGDAAIFDGDAIAYMAIFCNRLTLQTQGKGTNR